MDNKIIDITSMHPTNMMITYIDKTKDFPDRVKQKRYFKKYKFYFAIITTIITNFKKDYIITFPFHIYEHIRDKNGYIRRNYERRPIVNE